MIRARAPMAVVCLLAVGIGCVSPPPPYDYSAFIDEDPRSLLIVPVMNSSPEVGADAYFLSTITIPLVERGYYVSFSGLITFRSFPAAEQVPLVPADRVLVETDAPYLAPTPHRGKRNEPAFVVETARALGKRTGVSLETAAARSRANARRFYGLD